MKKIGNIISKAMLVYCILYFLVIGILHFIIVKNIFMDNDKIRGMDFFHWKVEIFYNYFNIAYTLLLPLLSAFFAKRWWLRILLIIMPIGLWVYSIYVVNLYNPW